MSGSGLMSMLNSPLVTMGIIFGSIQLLRLVDLTSPKNVLILRMGYIGSQMLMLLFWTWMRSVVKKSKRAGEIVEYEEAARPFSSEVPKKTRKTFAEYDGTEVGRQLQQIIIGTIIMMLLHFWLGMVQPLFLQIIIPWKSLLTNPLVQIHLLNYPATGPLKRPFKQPNPFSEFLGEQSAEASPETAQAIEGTAATGEKDKNESGSETKPPRTGSKKKPGRKED